METACLLHDIGNPPFGHLGEAAIQEWFKKTTNESNQPTNDISSDEFSKLIGTDLIKFDGNPQGFRIVRLLSGNDEFGLNLTCPLLLSIVKYPHTFKTLGRNKKIGLFETCLSSYENACSKIKWPTGKPFPYMQIMDIADEIAYSMSDLEDALEKNIISKNDLLNIFKKFCDDEKLNITSIFKQNITLENFDTQTFLEFKTSIIHKAVLEVAKNYCIQLNDILSGQKVELFEEKSDVKKLLKKVKKYAIENIYSHESAEKIELAGRNIVQGLLKHYEILLILPYSKFIALLEGVDANKESPRDLALDYELRLYHRLPQTHISKYKHCCTIDKENELQHRAQLIVDYISGMTDDFALEMYQLLEGIRIQ